MIFLHICEETGLRVTALPKVVELLVAECESTQSRSGACAPDSLCDVSLHDESSCVRSPAECLAHSRL